MESRKVHTETKDQSMVLNQVLQTEQDFSPKQQSFCDSRNFMVFEEKVGENTLTRKDSLILALM